MFLNYVRETMNGQWTNGHHNSQMSSLEICNFLTKIVFGNPSEIIYYWKKIQNLKILLKSETRRFDFFLCQNSSQFINNHLQQIANCSLVTIWNLQRYRGYTHCTVRFKLWYYLWPLASSQKGVGFIMSNQPQTLIVHHSVTW